MAEPRRIPAPVAAQQAQLTREALIRRIQTGAIRGERINGRWLVEVDSLQEYLAREEPAAA